MHQSTQENYGPLTMPKALRRPTGAHAIIASLLLADLITLLLWLSIGAFAGPPLWWGLRLCMDLLHFSLTLAIGAVLVGASLSTGAIRQLLFKQGVEDAWGKPSMFILLIIVTLALVALVKPSWMRVPAPIAFVYLEPLHWPSLPSTIGVEIAAGLFLLAHVTAFQRYRKEATEQLLPYSRAHPHGPTWSILDQAYGYYRRGLSRFKLPPIAHLKTPRAFVFYPPKPEPDEHANPEQECYWRAGVLVINQAYLGPKVEQTNILLPLVARLLHDYNGPDLLVEQLFSLAHQANSSALCSWMLLIPLWQAEYCEHRFRALERDRVLDRDRFAWSCGEGGRLRKLLQGLHADRLARGLPDNAVPTLTERIDHLESLLIPEASQVKALRAALPPAPTSPPTQEPPSSKHPTNDQPPKT